jgi:DNA polymerase I
MVLQVHDELVFEVAPARGSAWPELVRQQMQDVYRLQVPLKVSMASGRSWAEAQP